MQQHNINRNINAASADMAGAADKHSNNSKTCYDDSNTCYYDV